MSRQPPLALRFVRGRCFSAEEGSGNCAGKATRSWDGHAQFGCVEVVGRLVWSGCKNEWRPGD